MTDPLVRFTPAQLVKAKEELRADVELYQSLLEGMSDQQARAEMQRRGHGATYVSLLARRLAPKTDVPPKAKKTNVPVPVDSLDDRAAKPNLKDIQWFLGSYDLAPELDVQTGLAKWPLSFKRISKDTKVLPKATTKPGHPKPEQPPTAVS